MTDEEKLKALDPNNPFTQASPVLERKVGKNSQKLRSRKV